MILTYIPHLNYSLFGVNQKKVLHIKLFGLDQQRKQVHLQKPK